MFGDLMGNMDEHAKQLHEKLSSIEITESLEGISVKANAAGEILDITIADALTGQDNKEQLQDMLLVALNNTMSQIKTREAEVSQAMLNDMMPPGMSGLFG